MIPHAVERAEADVAFEAKRAELVATAKGKGWAVVDKPADTWGKRSFKTLAHWNGPPDLDLDVRKHEAEPCHAVMIPTRRTYYSTKPSATSICTDPARHGPKGASELKAKGALAKPKRVLQPWEVKQREDDKQRLATGRDRVAVLAGAVAAHRNSRGRSPDPLALTLAATVHMAGADEARIACQILGLEAKSSEHRGALRALAGKGDHDLHRAAFAVALASVEAKLRWTHAERWTWPDVPPYYAYLATLGYEPTPWERERLDEATAKAEADRAGAD